MWRGWADGGGAEKPFRQRGLCGEHHASSKDNSESALRGPVSGGMTLTKFTCLSSQEPTSACGSWGWER